MQRETKIIIRCLLIIAILSFVIITPTISYYKSATQSSASLSLADWNVSLNQTGENSLLTIMQNSSNASYTVNITSTSEVDVKYSIVISNLPVGVEVSIDDGETFVSQDNDHKITFTNVGTILYTDSVKTKSHTLIFKATSVATAVDDQTVDIDVLVQQML